jgi:hypothetical protein
MNNIELGNVFNSVNDLMEEQTSLIFFNSLVLDNVVKQFSSISILHYQIKLFLSLNYLKWLANYTS